MYASMASFAVYFYAMADFWGQTVRHICHVFVCMYQAILPCATIAMSIFNSLVTLPEISN